LADKGEIQIKVLMFPLAMHKGAREQCIAVVCDKKSFDDLENGYSSTSTCSEGEKLVDETIALLSSKGITGTPTYIFSDGRFQSGVLEANALRLRLGIPVPPPVPGAPAVPAAPAAPAKKDPGAPPKK
jgi:thiol:disulfide interchange protein DsbC